jgi:hypothetical protein
MTQNEMLDRIVEIYENNPSPLPEELLPEWRKLNDDLRELDEEKCYGLGFYHKGYTINLHGSKIFLNKMSKEQYCDMLDMFRGKITVKEFNKKW